MTKLVICAAVCVISLGACHIKNMEDCDDDWSSAGAPDLPDLPRGGRGGDSGNSSGGNGAAGGTESSGTAGGTAGSDGSGTGGTDAAPPAPTPCAAETDCPRGFNCDYERGECTPADAETCGELSTEEACDNRNDCMTVYAGTNCSCGPECACIGGEPGCVCESFAFFACENAVE
jgi:hypothetical protein